MLEAGAAGDLTVGGVGVLRSARAIALGDGEQAAAHAIVVAHEPVGAVRVGGFKIGVCPRFFATELAVRVQRNIMKVMKGQLRLNQLKFKRCFSCAAKSHYK